MKLALRIVAGLLGLQALSCVVLGPALLVGGFRRLTDGGVLLVLVGVALVLLGYYGAFAAGGLWEREERGRRAAAVSAGILLVGGIACAAGRWRFSAVGVVYEMATLAVLLMPAARRACLEESPHSEARIAAGVSPKVGPREDQRQMLRRSSELRDLLNEWDPIGVIQAGGPTDEYECLVSPVMRLLGQDAAPAQLVAYLREEFADHFGMVTPPAGLLEFATAAKAWFEDGGVNR